MTCEGIRPLAVSAALPASPFRTREAFLRAAVERNRSNLAREIEGFKATVLSGHEAVRTGLLIHGGAAAAVLALLSHLLTTPTGSAFVQASRIADSLLWFAGAVFCVGLVSACAYVTQRLYGASMDRAGHLLNALAVVIGLASYGCFVAGVYETYRAVTSISRPVHDTPEVGGTLKPEESPPAATMKSDTGSQTE